MLSSLRYRNFASKKSQLQPPRALDLLSLTTSTPLSLQQLSSVPINGYEATRYAARRPICSLPGNNLCFLSATVEHGRRSRILMVGKRNLMKHFQRPWQMYIAEESHYKRENSPWARLNLERNNLLFPKLDLNKKAV